MLPGSFTSVRLQCIGQIAARGIAHKGVRMQGGARKSARLRVQASSEPIDAINPSYRSSDIQEGRVLTATLHWIKTGSSELHENQSFWLEMTYHELRRPSVGQ